MIRGVVTQFKARVPVQVRGSEGQRLTIQAAVDTGFNGMLALPAEVIASLGLPWESEGSGVLADGRISYFDIYTATVLWHGRIRTITVSGLDMYPSIRMGLLDGDD
ncbi:MAG: clan AA aspartic protease [Planctomycetes bacterium]|nr:clan AA aspartic protease [Planctomycetota bacterium]